MSSYDKLIRDLARETRAPDAAVDALAGRLEQGELASHAPLPELGGLGAASDDRVDALRRRIRIPERRRNPWVIPAFAAAAAALLFALWPAADVADPTPIPQAVVSPPEEPEPQGMSGSIVDLDLTGVSRQTLPNGVVLSADGDGVVDSEGPFSDVVWTAGRIRVEVPPNQGLDVSVRTPDATVEVVGTVFSVERGEAGTTTSVVRGKVRVTCVGGEPTVITKGQSVSCARKRASQLLALARRASSKGGTIDEIVSILDTALLDPTAPAAIRQELLFQSAVWLERSGQQEVAIERLRLCLVLGDGLRAPDAEAMLARLAPQ